MDRFRHPPVPPEEDPAMEGTAGNGVRWAVYDTFCKHFGPEEKAKADREIADAVRRAGQRRALAEQKSE